VIESNKVLDKLPKHLMDLVIDQPYTEYSPQDHAVWRYVMQRNVDFLQHVAHSSYLEGLSKTGISIDKIPHMYGMNRILKEIGWAAVAVDGFIPPAAFMEFQAYNVLVIAADIRPIDQIEYTPAPDIIHEAAGHAPIIADPEYAEYLKYFGEIGAKAFSSAQDFAQYKAIRHLSILKSDPYSSKQSIHEAEQKLDTIERAMGMPSEMSQIRNLHWWTVEYGLIGNLHRPKIYGAGLLSSIGESYSSLQPDVKKIPYTLAAKDYAFDITTRQPQLFVTPDFKELTSVLDEFAMRIAYRTGSLEGINKAIESGHVATCQWSSGLQVSGVFTDVFTEHEQAAYIKTTGPTQMAFDGKELAGHGKDYHKDGFGSPIGRLKSVNTPLRFLNDPELEDIGFRIEEKSKLEFESGVRVEGMPFQIVRKKGMIILISFRDCSVTLGGTKLFLPEWGIFDMAVGDEIVSAHNGPADADAYGQNYPVPTEKTHKIKHDKKTKKLHSIYQKLRDIRERNQKFEDYGSTEKMKDLWVFVKAEYPEEWLLPLEILEIMEPYHKSDSLYQEIHVYLNQLASRKAELSSIISNGINLSQNRQH
jgi:phenylalanine-4-hydroxylase